MNPAASIQRFFRHTLWLAGFRSLFLLGFVAGAVLPLLWYAMYVKPLTLTPNVTPLQWHVHEMLFGFGWAVLGGFLLTASKNWAGVRGFHGASLFFLFMFWLLDRLAFWLPADTPALLLLLLHNAFLMLIVPMILWTLLTNLHKIAPDNGYFIIGLPIFLLGKNLIFTSEYFEVGWILSLGLFRMAIAMMLERTLFQFMKLTYQIEIPQHAGLDALIRLGLFIAVFESMLPLTLAIAVLALTATLLLGRFMLWRPLKGLSRLDTGVMFVGYLALVVGLYLECLRLSGQMSVIGDVATHTFTLLSMGLIMAGMMVRISQGHTARPIVFTASDKLAIWIAGLGGLARLLCPQFWPGQYDLFVLIAAVAWAICFTLLGWRLIPFLLKPRLDGKES
ncbi:MAG TPA: NnrS family protein [Gallionellaceae bacterium]|nr:NnrS family protein [Gallionellaceae bacterium]